MIICFLEWWHALIISSSPPETWYNSQKYSGETGRKSPLKAHGYKIAKLGKSSSQPAKSRVSVIPSYSWGSRSKVQMQYGHNCIFEMWVRNEPALCRWYTGNFIEHDRPWNFEVKNEELWGHTSGLPVFRRAHCFYILALQAGQKPSLCQSLCPCHRA